MVKPESDLEHPTDLAAELAHCRVLLAETQALAGIGHWEWEIATNRLTWSDENYRIYGLPPGCFRTLDDLYAVLPVARREAFTAYVERAMVDHQPYIMEVTVRRPDGEERIVHGRGRVILGENGEPVRFVGTTQDITERVRAEQALRDREAMLRAIIDHATDTIMIRDLAGRFKLVNPAAATTMGFAHAELVDVPAEDIYMPDTLASVLATDRQVIASGRPMEYESCVVLRSGRTIFTHTIKYPYRVAEGQIAGVVVMSRDITEQAHTRALLRRKEDEFHALVEKLPIMISRIDRQFRYVYVNRAVEHTSRYPRHGFIGHTARELGYPTVLVDQLEQELAQVFAEGCEVVSEFALDDGEGARWYQRRLVPEIGVDGRPETILSVTIDITERQRQFVELEALGRLKSQFVNSVSHELRTPLTSLLGYTEFLDEGIAGPLTERQRAFVGAIQGNARRLNRLVDDLLDCASSESGTFQVARAPSDLAATVAECLDAMAPLALQAGITLVQELEAPTLPVFVDAERILQVFGNLVGNALKFTPPGGRIIVRAFREPHGLRCEVRDTGPGIPHEQQQHLFERFRQVNPSSPRMGLGLGLAISRTIVEAHDGRIDVDSTPGAGSTFWFTLPA